MKFEKIPEISSITYMKKSNLRSNVESRGNCHADTLHDVWLNSKETKRIRSVTGRDFAECSECKDRDYCSVCMCRNFNERGDMFKPAEHFCKVAAINHEVVEEKERQMLEVLSKIQN